VMALAKALGNGFPIGACVARAKVSAALVPGTHGSTFGGNLLACTVANAVLDVMLEDGFLEHAARMGTLLRAKLDDVAAAYPSLLEGVRGMGLLLAIACKAPARDLMAALRTHGLLTVTAEGNALRILPPLIIDASHVEECVTKIDAACRELST